jgi:NAD(P)-dependent dehydrogenase (short-subunit alcohol dehydrogenase family)
MTDRLKGKTALVVGAGQTPGETIGNGRAIATLFAREGATVVCADRDLARAEETVAAIKGEGGSASAVQADVASNEDVEAMVREAVARLGHIDVLVNNVGIGGRDGPAHRLEEAAFDRTMAVNLKGMWLVCRAALPVMRDHGGGSIVNISSLAATSGAIQLAYELSKAGVNRLTTHIAQGNARHGVRANAIMMGFMDTPMAVGGIAAARGVPTSEVREQRDSQVPLGRKQGTGWDTAYAALFFASDESHFVTGQVLAVAGGMDL